MQASGKLESNMWKKKSPKLRNKQWLVKFTLCWYHEQIQKIIVKSTRNQMHRDHPIVKNK